jgi:hypothetical protein
MGTLKPFLNTQRNLYLFCVANIAVCCAIKIKCCRLQGFFTGVVCVAANE